MSVRATRLASIQWRPAYERICKRCGIDFNDTHPQTHCADCRPRKKDT